MLALITGGARSGKSGFAERYAAVLGGSGIYIATSGIYDQEMRERVQQHRTDRDASGFVWRTVEEPLELAVALRQICTELTATEAVSAADVQPVILIDCLTLWLTNVMLAPPNPSEDATAAFAELPDYNDIDVQSDVAAKVEQAIGGLTDVLRSMPVPVLLVTNEVGNGIVPEYPLGRLFRDYAGFMNQRIAAVCDQVFLVTAGIPVELKSQAFRLPRTGE